LASIRFFLPVLFLLLLQPSLLLAQNEGSVVDAAEESLLEEGEAVQEGELSKGEAEPELVYQSFVDSVKKIRMLATSEDYFMARHADADGRQLINYADGKFQRRFYDKNLRLEKIEYWKQGGVASKSEMERLLVFNKADREGFYSIFENNRTEKFERRSFYFADGRLKSERKNYFDEEGKLLSFDVGTFKYDKSRRTIQERLQKYNANEYGIRLFSDEIRNSKYDGKLLQETSYYKNGVLRVRTIYQDFDKGDYVRTTYFDGGIIVRDFYRDNVKIDTSMKGGGVQ